MEQLLLLIIFVAYSGALFTIGRLYEDAILLEEYKAEVEAEELKEVWNADY